MATATAAILWRMDTVAPKPPALVGLRLFALVYDLFPVLALWMLASLGFTLAYTAGGHDVHDNIPPFSPLQCLLWGTCWVIAGIYAVMSWHRGGQTLGMRPWRLRVTARDGTAPNAAYVAYDAGEQPVSPGDMLCNGQRQNYRTIADRRRDLGDGARTHCDIVVKVDEPGKRFFVIGGNSSRSVTMQILPGIREPGKQFRAMDGTQLRGLRTNFAHLKHRAPPIEANALDNTPTIKQLRCVVSFGGAGGAAPTATGGAEAC